MKYGRKWNYGASSRTKRIVKQTTGLGYFAFDIWIAPDGKDMNVGNLGPISSDKRNILRVFEDDCQDKIHR